MWTCVEMSYCSAVVHASTCVCASVCLHKEEMDRNRQCMSERDFSYLESAHVSWVPCILQTVLIALEKEL